MLSCDASLLIAFGGPTSPDEIRPFISRVLRGYPVPAERIAVNLAYINWTVLTGLAALLFMITEWEGSLHGLPSGLKRCFS